MKQKDEVVTCCDDNRPVMVSIRCITYNQESYIRQCLDGFVMQKANFRFEAIVHDDASTDRTTEIVREYAEKYPDIIKPIYETENQYSKNDGSLDRIMETACIGKYVAMCDGDDYWTDPLKLQKQVDFLEEHYSYSFVHTAFKYFYQDDDRFYLDVDRNTYIKNLDPDRILYFLLDKNKYRIQTCTVMYRKSAYDSVVSELKALSDEGYFFMGDTCIWSVLLSVGNVGYIENVTSVYRVLKESACRSNDICRKLNFEFLASEMRLYIASKNCLPLNRFLFRYYIFLLLCVSFGVEHNRQFLPFISKFVIINITILGRCFGWLIRPIFVFYINRAN